MLVTWPFCFWGGVKEKDRIYHNTVARADSGSAGRALCGFFRNPDLIDIIVFVFRALQLRVDPGAFHRVERVVDRVQKDAHIAEQPLCGPFCRIFLCQKVRDQLFRLRDIELARNHLLQHRHNIIGTSQFVAFSGIGSGRSKVVWIETKRSSLAATARLSRSSVSRLPTLPNFSCSLR